MYKNRFREPYKYVILDYDVSINIIIKIKMHPPFSPVLGVVAAMTEDHDVMRTRDTAVDGAYDGTLAPHADVSVVVVVVLL